jgi:RES domain-containing protein
MFVYRITQTEQKALDLSGTGAFLFGGRWNSAGTFMLYTSINSSLAYLETLVHFNQINMPPGLYVTQMEIDETLINKAPDWDYPEFWQQPDNVKAQALGDKWMKENKYLGFEVKSAINPSEFNFLLNPLFPRFHDLVKIISVTPLEIDTRLFR